MKGHYFVSQDNVFADLELADAEEMKTRSDLMSEVVITIRNGDLLQSEIAALLGISESKVSALMSGQINDFSSEMLKNYLILLV